MFFGNHVPKKLLNFRSWRLNDIIRRHPRLVPSQLRDFHPVTSRGQRGKHVENTSAAFRIKGVAGCALRLLAQPFSRPIFPIPVLVVLFPGAGGPGIPWYSAYTHTCVRMRAAVRNYNGHVRKRRRRNKTRNIGESRIRFIGKSRRVLDPVFIKYRRRLRRDIMFACN